MKKIIGIVLLLACALAAYFGYVKYSEHKLIESLAPHIKNTSLRVANALAYENDSANMTFIELFSKIESDIAEIDKRLLEVQTIASPANKAKTDAVIDYLKSGQGLLRSLLGIYQKELAIITGTKVGETIRKAYENSNSYTVEYAKNAYEEAEENLRKAYAEKKEARTVFLASLKIMDKSRVKMSAFMPAEKLLDSTVLKKIIDAGDAAVVAEAAQKAKESDTNTPASSGNAVNLKGKVVETLDASGYTYIRLDDGSGKEVWVATPKIKVKVGQEISLQGGSVMENFNSKPLNRTFEKLVFVNGISMGN